jgi:hypothetical protein
MSADSESEGPAMVAAEEVLRTIYGDDLEGCTVKLETIASIIQDAIEPDAAKVHELLSLYEKLVEALHLLATPPENAKLLGADELRSLLGDRLDAIQVLTGKTMETTAALAARQRPDTSG